MLKYIFFCIIVSFKNKTLVLKAAGGFLVLLVFYLTH